MRVSGSNQTHSVNHATISGMNCIVRGHHNTVSGMNAKVYGDDNVVSGMNAVVRGNRNIVSGMNAKAYGEGNVVTGMGSKSNGTKVKSKVSKFNISGATIGNVGSCGTVNMYGNGGGMEIVMGDDVIVRQYNTVPVINQFGDQVIRTESVPEPQYVEGPTEAELSHDVEGDGCVVCLSNHPICIVWPCRHACLCAKCARTLCFGQNGDPQEVGTVNCPKCRGATEKILRIH